MPRVATHLDPQAILERIKEALRTDYDKVANEQLPSRWVDLIRYLDDKERKQSEAPRRKPEPPPEY